MFKILISILAVGLLIFLPLSSAISKNEYIILSYGSLSCGRYTANGTKADLDRIGFRGWALGYITAYNMFAQNNKADVSEGVDNKGLEAWLDNFCSANPLVTFERAVAELIMKLEKQRR